MTKPEAEKLWALYCKHGRSASALSPLIGRSPGQCRERIRRAKAILAQELDLRDPEDIERENRINELLENVNAPDEALGKGTLRRAEFKAWGTAAKNDDTQEIIKDGLHATKLVYDFNQSSPPFPLVQPAEPTSFHFTGAPTILRKVRRAVIISDAQIGFIVKDGELIPTHDPAALEVAERITADVAPDELDWIGDWMDWSMLSRWPKKPEYVNTTQASIQAGYDWAGRLIVAAGKKCKRKRKVKGNHDDRPQIFIRDINLEAMGLRRASDTTGWPVFSTEFLLRYDELGIEVSDPYPNGTVWLTDDLMLTHAPPKKLEIAASVIHGHLHKLTRTTWAQTNVNGRSTFFLYDVGCVCKIDGTVPSDRARTDWAQGIAVVEMIDGKIPMHSVEQIHIENGRALFAGKLYQAKSMSKREVA